MMTINKMGITQEIHRQSKKIIWIPKLIIHFRLIDRNFQQVEKEKSFFLLK
jgi:hypothetical protein